MKKLGKEKSMNNHEDMKQIKDVISNYTTGTYEANIEKLKSVFHENAVMNGYLGDEELIARPEAFIQDMASSESMRKQGIAYNAEIEYIRIEGRIATVIVSETGFKGSGTLVNHFHMIKTEKGWKIISKLFTTV